MAEADLVVLPRSVREFRPRCPGCTLQHAVAEDAKPCSFYDCPGLPEELKVTCDLCLFDFVANDGQVKCDQRICATALRLKGNVKTYLAWVEILKAEESARTHTAV
jgi:hypothetical protein